MVAKLAKTLINTFTTGSRVYFIGNGGSATQSSHFSAELLNKYQIYRKPLPALALNDMAVVTAISNDLGYKYVFSRQLEALGNPGDLLIALSTSGKSENVNYAISTAKELGMQVVEWPRKGNNVGEIQNNQVKLMHDVCEIVEGHFAHTVT